MDIIKKLATLLLFALCPRADGMAATDDMPEEIVVTGRLPGPPLWKVSNGDKVLWIFPYLDWIPKDMLWDSERVARVIAESQEVLELPERGVSVSPLVALNPINAVRGGRVIDRLERNPDGGTLEDNLPPALYARFAALQARYFPRMRDIVEQRPYVAGRRMSFIIHAREGLVPGDDILKAIRRLVRRNRNIERTEISVRVELDGGYREVVARFKAIYESFPFELEQACFEQQVRHMEQDLDAVKSRAYSWAQGYLDEFRNVSLTFDESNACDELFEGASSAARDTWGRTPARLSRMWLDAAEKALTMNASTFAILPIDELLAGEGVLRQLRARGYVVREP